MAITLSNVADERNMICSAVVRYHRSVTDVPDSPHERLRYAREKSGYRDAAEFAALEGIKPVTYRAYENGQNGFAKYAPRFTKRLGVSVEWLLCEAGGEIVLPDHATTVKSEDGSIGLRHVDMSLAMGDGTNIDDYFEEGVFEFDASLLRTISRAPAHRLVVGHGIGDSMMPTIHDDALVIFDTTQTVLNSDDRIWAISLYGAGSIKRLQVIGGLIAFAEKLQSLVS